MDERIVDWDRLTKHVGKDPEFLRDLLALFQKEKSKHALSIQKALSENNHDLLKKATHALKGVVGNLCAPQVFEEASRLEACSRQGGFAEAKALWSLLEKSLEKLALDFKRRIMENFNR